MRGRRTAGPSGSPAATPRHSSPCSCWPAGRAPGKPSPQTCGRTRTGHPPARCARRSWLVRQGLADAGFGAGAVLDIEADTVGIRLDASIDLDVDRFEAMTTDALGAEAAVELYHGDLLEGLGHECFAAERERLSDRFEDALAIVAERRLADGDAAGAQAAADRLLERDPLREEAHAVLIAVHGLIGSRSQVIRQYRRLHDVLARELDETPLPDTEAIYRLALDQTMRRATERAAELDAERSPQLRAVPG